MTIREAKTFGQSELEKYFPSASLDVNCLLEHILQCDKTFLLLHANENLTAEQETDFYNAIEKRKTGLPIAYITNHKEFYGYDFYVTQDVLIPKPDTETLVENAVREILSKTEARSSLGNLRGEDAMSSSDNRISDGLLFPSDRHFGSRRLKICDMCTGSGCIGIAVYLSLKEKLPENKLPEITFVDISDEALEIAKKNAERLIGNMTSTLNSVTENNTSANLNASILGSSQFHFIKSNLFENISDTFDFILTNPPYIPSRMVDELLRDGRNEPRLALDGDGMTDDVTPSETTSTDDCMTHNVTPVADGLGIIRNLIPQMKNHLARGGMFFMETGEYNAEEAARICEENGFQNVEIIRDLEGQLRVVKGNI